MSWNNCRRSIFVPRSTFTSALFKVLLTLKLLHGGRTGMKGSTLEDIAMHMIKHFCLDGDIKSQVLASLKYGVKMHFIQKRKDKFSLVLPASSIHLAPCKFKNEEMERLKCIFPPKWHSNACADMCASDEQTTCCGKKRKAVPNVCCGKQEEEEEENPCQICKKKSKNQQPVCGSEGGRSKASTCSACYPQPKKKKKKPCRKIRQSVCSRKGKCGGDGNKSLYDDYCQLCPQVEEDDEEDECPDCVFEMKERPDYSCREE